MNHWSTKFDLFLLRWGTSLTCVTYARCQQTRRRRLRRRTTWVSLKPLRWTPPTWRLPSTIFSQVTPGFFLQSTAFPILSLPMTKNTWVCCGWLLIKIIGEFCPRSAKLLTLCAKYSATSFHMSEIHRIVSQKSALSPGEEDVIRPANLETINVKPTVNTEAVRRQCCSS